MFRLVDIGEENGFSFVECFVSLGKGSLCRVAREGAACTQGAAHVVLPLVEGGERTTISREAEDGG